MCTNRQISLNYNNCVPSYSSSLNVKGKCTSGTCCLIIACADSEKCLSMSYSSSFIGTLNDGAISGIVIGSIVFIVLAVVGVRFCMLRRQLSNQEVGVGGGYQQQFNPVSYQEQSYQQPAPIYQQQQPVYISQAAPVYTNQAAPMYMSQQAPYMPPR